MKYLKILPVVIAATFVSQGAMAISSGAGQKSDAVVAERKAAAAQQQAAAQLLGQRNARLTHLNLPNTDDYRTALIANGDHNGAATAGVIVLQVMETGGVANVNHANAPQVAAADALLAIPGVTHADVTLNKLRAAHRLGAAGLPVDLDHIQAAEDLQALVPPLPVNVRTVPAVLKLKTPDDGGPALLVDRDHIRDADALLEAVGGPLDVNNVNIGIAAALRHAVTPVTDDSLQAYAILQDIGIPAGNIDALKINDIVGQGNLRDKRATVLIHKINKHNRHAQYIHAARAFADDDAAWKKATRADLRAWRAVAIGDVAGRAQIVTDVANR